MRRAAGEQPQQPERCEGAPEYAQAWEFRGGDVEEVEELLGVHACLVSDRVVLEEGGEFEHRAVAAGVFVVDDGDRLASRRKSARLPSPWPNTARTTAPFAFTSCTQGETGDAGMHTHQRVCERLHLRRGERAVPSGWPGSRDITIVGGPGPVEPRVAPVRVPARSGRGGTGRAIRDGARLAPNW